MSGGQSFSAVLCRVPLGGLLFSLCRGAACRAPTRQEPCVFRQGADQGVFASFTNCCLLPPAFQAGGSLAGKDSIEASSTMSSASSWGGVSRGSTGAGCVSCG